MVVLSEVKLMITFDDYFKDPSISNRNELVVANINLARFAAHRLANRTSIPYKELEQVAFIGLILAVERYDPNRGAKFSTFAIPLINGRILNFIRDNSYTIRIPRSCVEVLQKGKKVVKNLSKSLGRSPSSEEFFEALLLLGVTQKTFIKAREAYQTCKHIKFYDSVVNKVSGVTDLEYSPGQFLTSFQCGETYIEDNLNKEILFIKTENLLDADIIDLTYQELASRLYFFESLSLSKISKFLEMNQLEVIALIRDWCQSI